MTVALQWRIILALIWVTKSSLECTGRAEKKCVFWNCADSDITYSRTEHLKDQLSPYEVQNQYLRENPQQYYRDRYGYRQPYPTVPPISGFRCTKIDITTSTIRTLTRNFLLELDYVQALSLRDVKLEELTTDAFSDQKELKELRITENRIKNVTLGMFNHLTRLQILDLRNNKISVIDDHAFWGVLSLEELYLSHNNISVLSDTTFTPLPKLQVLDLSGNPLKIITNVTLPVSRFYSNKVPMETLTVESDTILLGTEDGFFFILNATKITEIGLSGNGITSLDNELGMIETKLKRLDLSGNSLPFLGTFLRNVYELEFLDLSYNQLNELDKDSFVGLRYLGQLSLRKNNLSYLIHGVFEDLVNLTSLDISQNQIKQIQFGLFDSFEKLTSLNISDNLITRMNLHFFHNRAQLFELYLDNNHLENLELPGIFFPHAKISLNKNDFECHTLYKIFILLDMQEVEVVDKKSSNTLTYRGIECQDETNGVDGNIMPTVNLSALDGSKFLKFFKSDFEHSAFFKFFDKFNATTPDRYGNSEKFLNFFKTDYRRAGFFKYFDKFSGPTANRSELILSNEHENDNVSAERLVSDLEHILERKTDTQPITYFQVIGVYAILAVIVVYLYVKFSKRRRISSLNLTDNNL